MEQTKQTKFIYKKDHYDLGIIFIIILTLACFGLIFYGSKYFNDATPVVDNGSDISELIKNKTALEKQIQDYQSQQGFSVEVQDVTAN